MMSGLDGSGAVHTVLPWEAFGGHVPPGGSEMYWFDQSNPRDLMITRPCGGDTVGTLQYYPGCYGLVQGFRGSYGLVQGTQ